MNKGLGGMSPQSRKLEGVKSQAGNLSPFGKGFLGHQSTLGERKNREQFLQIHDKNDRNKRSTHLTIPALNNNHSMFGSNSWVTPTELGSVIHSQAHFRPNLDLPTVAIPKSNRLNNQKEHTNSHSRWSQHEATLPMPPKNNGAVN